MSPDSGITIRILPTELNRTIRTVDYRLTDDQIRSSTQTMEIDRIKGISITKEELVDLLEIFLVHRQDKDGTFVKVNISANRNLFNLEVRHLEDQMVTQALVSFLTNKNFCKAAIKPQRTWFAPPPLMIAITNYQYFVR